MWAQLIKATIKPGREGEVRQIYDEYDRQIDAGTGWVRSFSLINRNNRREMYGLVMFESEEKAREYERSGQQSEMTARLGECMEGAPTFVDFDDVVEYAPRS